MARPNNKKSCSLHSIKIEQLKSLKNVVITFRKEGLTAIMGPNGCGKSTILHALACVHQGNGTHLFCEYFIPTIDNQWKDSRFEIEFSYFNGNREEKGSKCFCKQNGRWSPRYNTRYHRDTIFIGVRTCVPQIEIETQHSKRNFRKTILQEQDDIEIRTIFGRVMNRTYDELHSLSISQKKYKGVKNNDLVYSSLSMGAGEQRILRMIEDVYRIPDHSLILIDELDILIHQEALLRLLKELSDVSKRKHLQIIFTTHHLAVCDLDYIDVRHIYHTPQKTMCFTKTTPDTLHRLTGIMEKQLEIFVEDKFASVIVRTIADAIQCAQPILSVRSVGSYQNCISAACGVILNSLDNIDNMLFVMDGDICVTEQDKRAEIQRHIVGDDSVALQKRDDALRLISQFAIPNGKQPEQYIHELIVTLSNIELSPKERQIHAIAETIQSPQDKHDYINEIVRQLGGEPDIVLYDIVRMAAKNSAWESYVSPVKEWLNNKVVQIYEH